MIPAFESQLQICFSCTVLHLIFDQTGSTLSDFTLCLGGKVAVWSWGDCFMRLIVWCHWPIRLARLLQFEGWYHLSSISWISNSFVITRGRGALILLSGCTRLIQGSALLEWRWWLLWWLAALAWETILKCLPLRLSQLKVLLNSLHLSPELWIWGELNLTYDFLLGGSYWVLVSTSFISFI